MNPAQDPSLLGYNPHPYSGGNHGGPGGPGGPPGEPGGPSGESGGPSGENTKIYTSEERRDIGRKLSDLCRHIKAKSVEFNELLANNGTTVLTHEGDAGIEYDPPASLNGPIFKPLCDLQALIEKYINYLVLADIAKHPNAQLYRDNLVSFGSRSSAYTFTEILDIYKESKAAGGKRQIFYFNPDAHVTKTPIPLWSNETSPILSKLKDVELINKLKDNRQGTVAECTSLEERKRIQLLMEAHGYDKQGKRF